ncbi:MAG: hypothetical protein AAF581_06070 [Planctomycetota bacterium]
MQESLPQLENALRRLRSLRAQRRRLRSINGLMRFCGWVAVLIWISFFLDWTLELPWGIRLFHALAGTVLAFVGVRVLWFGTRRRLSLEQLASRVEGSVEELDQALITAVQLTRADNPRRDLYSPELLARTVRDAEQKMAALPVDRLLSKRSLGLSFMVLLALVLPLVVFGGARPDLAKTYVDRDVLLRNVPWPREYWLERIEPAPDLSESLLAMGDPFSVVVEKVRGGSARVFLDCVYADGDEETFSLERKGENRYRKVFRNVSRDFQFTVRAGDYRSGEHRVVVRLRPRIEEIELAFQYPEYTGITGDSDFTAELGGHLRVPAHTEVAFRARTSLPVQSAVCYSQSRRRDAEKVEIPTELSDQHVLTGQFAPTEDGYYWFQLVSSDGFENASPIRYRVAVIPDRPPSVLIDKPGKNLEVSERAQFTIVAEAQDDYGVTGSQLVLTSLAEGDAAIEAPLPMPELTVNVAAAEADRDFESRGSYRIDLEALAQTSEAAARIEIAEGARIEYEIRVQDSIGQEGVSRKYLITVVREEDLIRIIQDELSSLRQNLEDVLTQQKEARREMERVLDDTQVAQKVLDQDVATSRHIRLAQEKVNQRLDDSDERLAEIIERVVENRLNNVKELPWIEGLRAQVQKGSREVAPKAVEALDQLVEKGKAGNADEADVEKAIKAMKDNEGVLTDVLQELREWGDLRTIVRKLEELLNTEIELEQKVEEKVKEELGQ